jgi:hypothetical protein
MAIYVGKLRLIECGQVAEEEQPRHDHIPALFYRRSAIPGDATPAPQPTPAPPPPRIKGIGAYSVTL